MASIFRKLIPTSLWVALLAWIPVFAGEFTVNPIRVELGASVKSGVITIRNEGNEKLTFQLQSMAWTQDDTGQDRYEETRELIFLPKILSVEPGEEGLIRVGARNTTLQTEKTFRLFIEEMPAVAKAQEGGTAAVVNVLIRFGAPIFVAPLKPQDSLVINSVSMAKGVLTVSATNTGNRHQTVQGIDLKGTDAKGIAVYGLTLSDRYLLAGTSKSFSATIAADQCDRIAALAVEVKTDKAGVSQNLAITPAMCR